MTIGSPVRFMLSGKRRTGLVLEFRHGFDGVVRALVAYGTSQTAPPSEVVVVVLPKKSGTACLQMPKITSFRSGNFALVRLSDLEVLPGVCSPAFMLKIRALLAAALGQQ